MLFNCTLSGYNLNQQQTMLKYIKSATGVKYNDEHLFAILLAFAYIDCCVLCRICGLYVGVVDVKTFYRKC